MSLTKFRNIFQKIKNLISIKRRYLLAVFLIGLIFDVFFYPKISDLSVIILIAIWIVVLRNFKFKSSFGLIFATASYLFAFIFQFFGQMMITEKAASWFFIFLTISLVQKIIEGQTKNEK